jgi:hypothetical protein
VKTSIAQTIIREFTQEALEDYVNYRLEALYKEFETVKPDHLGALQGRITEVKLLLRARIDAQNVLNLARKG